MLRQLRRISLPVCLVALCAFTQNAALPAPPDTPKRPVVDEYHGVKVTDQYRWLENWDDPAVKRWSAAENARTRGYFDHLASRPAIRERLKQISADSSVAYSDVQFRAGMLFAVKSDPRLQHPTLVMLHSADDPASAKILFDSGSAQGNLAVDFYVPSFGAKYVALAVSQNGSEDSSGRVIEVASGKELPDVVPRVNFATGGGSIAWKADSSGFYYTRYPQGNERPAEDANFYQQIYFHKLGTDAAQDSYVQGKDFPRIAETRLQASNDGRWLLASVANGDGGQFAYYIMDQEGTWAEVARFDDGIESVKFGPSEHGSDSALYLLSRKGAPRGQILRMPLTSLTRKEPPFHLAQAEVVVPQTIGGANESDRASIEDFVPAADRLYVLDIIGGPSRLRVFDRKGQALPAPELPPIAAADDLVDVGGGDILLRLDTYLQPAAWYRVDGSSGKSTRTALAETSSVHFDDTEVTRVFVTSKDGTRVPLNLVAMKGTKLDGTHPTLLEAYGGYAISTKPHFLGGNWRMWLEHGGIFAEANIRGGAEYGEEWHQGGNLTHKQNVFDDFLACGQYLVDRHYTSPEHLAILGGSNGGLLMGAAFTQRPDMFRAVVSYVGIYDMLRVELDANGQFNTTEYGSEKDPEQFKALYAYSPYHHVKDGTVYPAILMPTGENDHRVNPMQSRKMIARLQAADGGGRPILLRTSSTSGHGFGTARDERIEEDADVFSFLFDQLGVQYAAAGQ